MTDRIRCYACNGSGWITTNDRIRPPHARAKSERDEARAEMLRYRSDYEKKALYQRSQWTTGLAHELLSAAVDWLVKHVDEPEDRYGAIHEVIPLFEEILMFVDDD